VGAPPGGLGQGGPEGPPFRGEVVEVVNLELSEREAKALLNLLDGEHYWGELPEVLERVLKALKQAVKDRRQEAKEAA
jgi:hypothetical protein